MSVLHPMFAATTLTPADVAPRENAYFDPATKEGLIVLAAIALLTLFLLAGAYLLYRRQRRHGSHRHTRERSAHHESAESTEGENGEPRRRRRRRRRREHRPRNPTLAETGGLPPVRREDPEVEP
jgi:hypothetical protein